MPQKVLLCSSATFHSIIGEHDLFLSQALRERGAEVSALLCGGALPACEVCTLYDYKVDAFLAKGPQGRHCGPCAANGRRYYGKAGVPVHLYAKYVLDSDHREIESLVDGLTMDEMASFVDDGIRVGEEAQAGTFRFFVVGSLDGIAEAPAVMRRYLKAALLARRVATRALQELQPDVTVFHHGIYVPLGVFGQVARKLGVRVVNWAVGYRKQCFVYSHDDTYHKTMIDEPVALWRDKPLSTEQDACLMDYLDGRMTSKHDWIKHHTEPEDDPAFIKKTLGLDDRPMILALTNVTWDAQLFYKSNAFPSIIDWLCHTITTLGARPDLQLVVRVHPSEVRGNMPTRQPIMSIISRRIPSLPPNVHVVGPESRISTYALGEMSNATIIYGTKTGVELTCRGIPVIVCGEAWIRNKGLTTDVTSPANYDEVIRSLPLAERMPADQIELARRYAYHYFFRRLIPNPFLVPRTKAEANGNFSRLVRRARGLSGNNHAYKFQARDAGSLRAGAPKEIDSICDGILNRKSFAYEELPKI